VVVGRCSAEPASAIAMEGTAGPGGYALGVGSVFDLFVRGSGSAWGCCRSGID